MDIFLARDRAPEALTKKKNSQQRLDNDQSSHGSADKPRAASRREGRAMRAIR